MVTLGRALESSTCQRKGVTLSLANDLLRQPNYYGPMMVAQGDADVSISGVTYNYPEVIRPALQCVGSQEGRCVNWIEIAAIAALLMLSAGRAIGCCNW